MESVSSGGGAAGSTGSFSVSVPDGAAAPSAASGRRITWVASPSGPEAGGAAPGAPASAPARAGTATVGCSSSSVGEPGPPGLDPAGPELAEPVAGRAGLAGAVFAEAVGPVAAEPVDAVSLPEPCGVDPAVGPRPTVADPAAFPAGATPFPGDPPPAAVRASPAVSGAAGPAPGRLGSAAAGLGWWSGPGVPAERRPGVGPASAAVASDRSAAGAAIGAGPTGRAPTWSDPPAEAAGSSSLSAGRTVSSPGADCRSGMKRVPLTVFRPDHQPPPDRHRYSPVPCSVRSVATACSSRSRRTR